MLRNTFAVIAVAVLAALASCAPATADEALGLARPLAKDQADWLRSVVQRTIAMKPEVERTRRDALGHRDTPQAMLGVEHDSYTLIMRVIDIAEGTDLNRPDEAGALAYVSATTVPIADLEALAAGDGAGYFAAHARELARLHFHTFPGHSCEACPLIPAAPDFSPTGEKGGVR